MACELIWETGGVYCRFSGTASDQDLEQLNRDISSDPRFESIGYEIADFTDVAELRFSTEIVRWIAARDIESSMRLPSIRVAIVGDQKMLMGLSNMYRAYFDLKGGKWEQGHFKTLTEARAWLGIADQFE